ncbi:MAG: nucleotidyltransferase domain-containing protein [bacterium]|nr:nucleotidyltransferase domain-containing protein [bacterium]
MQKLTEARRRQREELLEQARRYAANLQTLLASLAVVVTGSVARGDFNLWSDLDLIVIADDLPPHPLDRSELLYSVATGGVEPRGYTVAEFTHLLERGVPWAKEIRDQGVVVTGDHVWDRVGRRPPR